MGHIRDALERNIAERGGPMKLRRLPGPGLPLGVVEVQAAGSDYLPGQIEGAIQQGDRRILCLHAPIAAAGFGNPGRGWQVVQDTKQEAVLGAHALREGGTVIGWRLWVRE